MRTIVEYIDKMGCNHFANLPSGRWKRLVDADHGIIKDAIAAGDFRDATSYLHTVSLADNMREIVVTSRFDAVTCDLIERRYGVQLTPRGQRALEISVVGRYDLWFNDDGYAFISFENDGDAEMFVLALEGGAG